MKYSCPIFLFFVPAVSFAWKASTQCLEDLLHASPLGNLPNLSHFPFPRPLYPQSSCLSSWDRLDFSDVVALTTLVHWFIFFWFHPLVCGGLEGRDNVLFIYVSLVPNIRPKSAQNCLLNKWTCSSVSQGLLFYSQGHPGGFLSPSSSCSFSSQGLKMGHLPSWWLIWKWP